MAYLVLVRHGQSVWNAKGLWTGLTDVSLSEPGKKQAQTAGSKLKDIKLDIAFTSKLIRAQQTLDIILQTLSLKNIPIFQDKALNERDYGKYTGINKWKFKEEKGDEEFSKVRRSYDFRPPEGESLKDVYERVVPFYQKSILPYLAQSKNILIVAHGNSLRALVKYLDNLSDLKISKLEFGFDEIYIYETQDNKIIKTIK